MESPKRVRGFTLIELFVTIAVLAILVTLAVPAFNLAEQRRVVGAAEGALDQIQTARGEAIKQGRDVHFVVREDGDGSWCHGISTNPGCNCFITDADDPAACTMTLAGDDAPVLRTATSDDARNIGMTGAQSLTFSHVRGTVAGGPEDLTFTSSPNGFEMQVRINAIGRPSACGTNRPMGAYDQCP